MAGADLFATLDGPWLHSVATALTEDEAAPVVQRGAADGLLSAATIKLVLQSVTSHRISAIDSWCKRRNPVDGKLLHTILGRSNALNPTDEIRVFVEQSITAMVVDDRILHTIDPGGVAPEVSNAYADPPPIGNKVVDAALSVPLYKVLEEAHDCAKRYRRELESPLDNASKYLEALTSGCSQKCSGHRAIAAIRQAAHVVGYCLSGGKDFGPDFVAFTVQEAAHLGLSAPHETVAAHFKTGAHFKQFLGPIWYALGHSVLSLLSDRHSPSSRYLAHPYGLFTRWKASGNARIKDARDPLTRAEDVLWRLLIRTALHEIEPAEAYTEFFKHDHVIAALGLLRTDRDSVEPHATTDRPVPVTSRAKPNLHASSSTKELPPSIAPGSEPPPVSYANEVALNREGLSQLSNTVLGYDVLIKYDTMAAENQTLRDASASLQTHINSWTKIRAALDSEIVELNQFAATRNREIVQLTADLEARCREVGQLEAELYLFKATGDGEIAKLKEEIRDLREDLKYYTDGPPSKRRRLGETSADSDV
ncbi:hypothetical protein DFH06DRAFT_1231410 [Mycena polygramma]|nr:hypothetical protein DFH06DRAFT_1231410 [Mycena polygramma]